ncbi:hypothetical protein LTR93_011173 [Exophiala xenobiotica]|nr:hypothetical protein LTR93_011173 [Exophiala xenobiotica]
MVRNYGEGKEMAYKRLQEEKKNYTRVGALDPHPNRPMELTEPGDDPDQFVVGFDLSAIPEAVEFVARENELAEMRRILHGHKARSAVVLHGLGKIRKPQLAIEYTRGHKETTPKLSRRKEDYERNERCYVQYVDSGVLIQAVGSDLFDLGAVRKRQD